MSSDPLPPVPQVPPVPVAVVGAGIGGLTLAAALARVGIDCVVFEQARELAEVGAGVQLAPNATRPLHRLGLGPALRAHGVRPEATEVRRWDDGHLLSRLVLGGRCERMYGAPYYTVHRADLHAGLVGLVTDRPLRLGHRLVGVSEHADRVDLRFADGTEYSAALVVGADGIHSVVREALVRDAPVFSGHGIYRALVPGEQFPALVREPRIRVWVGPERHCVCYPVSGGRAISVAATAPAPGWSTESWSAAGDPADLRAAYRGWNDEVSSLLQAVDAARRWALHDREPLPRWCTGRLAVLGDAAHPMLPFLAQGANQAVEDAVALAGCLTGLGDAAEIPARLRRYERSRIPRTAAVQRGSRGSGRALHLADGADQRRRDQAMRPATEPDGADPDAPLRAMSWLYAHDAELAR